MLNIFYTKYNIVFSYVFYIHMFYSLSNYKIKYFEFKYDNYITQILYVDTVMYNIVKLKSIKSIIVY